MSKTLPDDAFDAALDWVAQTERLVVCSAAPANYAGVAAVALADVAVTPGDGNGDFTIANGDVSGRKLTVAAQAGVTVDSSGTANHVALVDDTADVLRAVTDFTGQAVTAGNTIDIGTFKLELADPS